MKPLRQYVRDVQLLEAQATEKTGQRFLMIDWTEFSGIPAMTLMQSPQVVLST